MTLSELITRVRNILDEPDTTGFFSNDEITNWLNEGHFRVATMAKHLKESSSIDTVDGTESYELPSDFIEEFQIQFDGDKINKIPMEEDEQGYYIWEDDIYISLLGAGELSLFYYRKPVKMVADSDEPEVPEEYQDILVYYACHRAKQKDSQFNEGEAFRRNFLEGVAEMKARYSRAPRRNTWKVIR